MAGTRAPRSGFIHLNLEAPVRQETFGMNAGFHRLSLENTSAVFFGDWARCCPSLYSVPYWKSTKRPNNVYLKGRILGITLNHTVPRALRLHASPIKQAPCWEAKKPLPPISYAASCIQRSSRFRSPTQLLQCKLLWRSC